MFEQLRSETGKTSLDQMEQEISMFTKKLSVMNDETISMVIVMATHQRYVLEQIRGFDLFEPLMTMILTQQTAALFINKAIKQLQKNGELASATGMMVWLHSLRSGSNFKLRDKGLNMWGELQRGFINTYIENAKEYIELKAGFDICIDGYHRFPNGLDPKVQMTIH